MEKYVVIPPRDKRKTYDEPLVDDWNTFYVKIQGQRAVRTLRVFVRKAILDWAPDSTIRVEGHTKTTGGTRGVLGYYKLHSTDQWLGELHVQDI